MYGTQFSVGSLSGLMVLVVLVIVAYRLIKGEPNKNEKDADIPPEDVTDTENEEEQK